MSLVQPGFPSLPRPALLRSVRRAARHLRTALAVALLGTPLLAGASETLLQRSTADLSVQRAGSIHVFDDSQVALGAPKFLVWGEGANASQSEQELNLFVLGSLGNVISVRRFVNGLGQSCRGTRLIPTKDGGFAMLGYCTFPYFSLADISSVLFKLDSALNPVWSISLDQNPEGGTYFMGNDIKSLASGDLAVVGTISSPNGTQFANYNIAVLRLKPDGTPIWSNRYEILDVRAEGLAIHESLAGDLYVAGSIQPAGGLRQMMAMKLNAAGVRQWSYGYGINAVTDGAAYGIAQKSATGAVEEFYLAGYINAPAVGRGRDVHVVAIDANGNIGSSHAIGTAAQEEARWLSVLPKTSGNLDSLFFTGIANGIGAGQDDAILMQTLGTSIVQDFTTHGGTGADAGREVKLNGGRVYAVGDLLNPQNFGSSARKGLLVVDDIGPPPARGRCGATHAPTAVSVAVQANNAKFKAFPLPLTIRTIAPMTSTTGSTVARCGTLPN